MKTVELKWIEDDNHTVAKEACDTLQGLIDCGALPDLVVKCEDGVLFITGEKENLDKAVMKIQKDYANYGQIMIKEATPVIKPTNKNINEDSLDDFDDSEIRARLSAQSNKVKEFVKKQRMDVYRYVEKIWSNYCIKNNIKREYNDISYSTEFGQVTEPGSTLPVYINIRI